jgi:uncharacterized protein YceH (UPF0502 family)
MSVVLTVAPTGPIATKADNPYLPTSPEEIADAVYAAYLEGASVAHLHLRDDDALRAVDGLRSKGLASSVSFTGSRVEKYRHNAGDTLGVRAPELALLAELLLRGPQTVGELRGRASRMLPFESIEVVDSVLAVLSQRSDPQSPLVRELPPSPGSRAPRWMQLLCEDLHPISGGASTPAAAPVRAASARVEPDRVEALEARVAALEARGVRIPMSMRLLCAARSVLRCVCVCVCSADACMCPCVCIVCVNCVCKLCV